MRHFFPSATYVRSELNAYWLAALPFDEQYRPKPAAAAMLRVLQQHADKMAAPEPAH